MSQRQECVAGHLHRGWHRLTQHECPEGSVVLSTNTVDWGGTYLSQIICAISLFDPLRLSRPLPFVSPRYAN
jgi:hypothetical protein